MASINETNDVHEGMNTALAGRVALVTGGNRGIGRAIALKLASLGAEVAICGRDTVKLAETESALRSKKIRAIAIAADVRKASDVAAALERVETKLGPVNLLVNNAGMGLFGPVHEKTEEEWDDLMK